MKFPQPKFREISTTDFSAPIFQTEAPGNISSAPTDLKKAKEVGDGLGSSFDIIDITTGEVMASYEIRNNQRVQTYLCPELRGTSIL